MFCIKETFVDLQRNVLVGITSGGEKVILEEFEMNPNVQSFTAGLATNSGPISTAPFIAMGFLAGITG